MALHGWLVQSEAIAWSPVAETPSCSAPKIKQGCHADVSVVLEGQLVPPSANRCLGGMQLVTQQAQQMLPQLAQSASSPQPLQGDQMPHCKHHLAGQA